MRIPIIWRTASLALATASRTSGVISSVTVLMSLTSIATKSTVSGISSGLVMRPILIPVGRLTSWVGVSAILSSKYSSSKITTVPGPYSPVCMASTTTAWEYP